MKLTSSALISAATITLGVSAPAWASGTILHGVITWASPADPIFATEQWASPSTSLTWDISYSAASPFPWNYEYTWSTSAKGLSHLILEVSTVATAANFSGLPSGSEGPKIYSPADPGGSNPGLPGAIYGIKYAGGGVTTKTIAFSSTQPPTWGDFYARDGVRGGGGLGSNNDVYAFSAGFLQPDPMIDLVAIANGDYSTLLHTGPRANHIAVPDTVNLPAVVFSLPESPVDAGLFGLLGVGCWILRGRRNRINPA